jgi:excisionase family DNA binding protein
MPASTLPFRPPTPAQPCPDASLPQGADADLQELLTVDELASLLKVSKSWVYEHTRSGRGRFDRLPHIRLGKYVRFDSRAVRTFLERRCRRT